ncbi:MAG: hypothetical protein EZS28_042131, partial [Streblomastix strix]
MVLEARGDAKELQDQGAMIVHRGMPGRLPVYNTREKQHFASIVEETTKNEPQIEDEDQSNLDRFKKKKNKIDGILQKSPPERRSKLREGFSPDEDEEERANHRKKVGANKRGGTRLKQSSLIQSMGNETLLSKSQLSLADNDVGSLSDMIQHSVQSKDDNKSGSHSNKHYTPQKRKKRKLKKHNHKRARSPKHVEFTDFEPYLPFQQASAVQPAVSTSSMASHSSSSKSTSSPNSSVFGFTSHSPRDQKQKQNSQMSFSSSMKDQSQKSARLSKHPSEKKNKEQRKISPQKIKNNSQTPPEDDRNILNSKSPQQQLNAQNDKQNSLSPLVFQQQSEKETEEHLSDSKDGSPNKKLLEHKSQSSSYGTSTEESTSISEDEEEEEISWDEETDEEYDSEQEEYVSESEFYSDEDEEDVYDEEDEDESSQQRFKHTEAHDPWGLQSLHSDVEDKTSESEIDQRSKKSNTKTSYKSKIAQFQNKEIEILSDVMLRVNS